MLTFIVIYMAVSFGVFVVSLLADVTDPYFGVSSWYKKHKARHRLLKTLEKYSPLRPWRFFWRLVLRFPRTSTAVGVFVLLHVWLHLANPYAKVSFFESPYKTHVTANGQISYEQVYKPLVLSDPLSDFAGYYRSGFLIAQNTLVGGKKIDKPTANEVIGAIHKTRFDPTKPYLISGDQFSVLYPRNLGVFYNQLLDPNTAHNKADWENRQRIYLQSVLFAIDGLSAGDIPKTTLVPMGPRTIASTRVHPGDYGSDAVYGTLYALKALQTPVASRDGIYTIQTKAAAERITRERREQLTHMVTSYAKTVQDPQSKLVKDTIHLSSARDGVSRRSSFYDNVVLWKTLALARELNIYEPPESELIALKNTIKTTYWRENNGYYANDRYDSSFSSDWLIGYVTGFFDLSDPTDQQRTERTVAYIHTQRIDQPLPIKYQLGKAEKMPLVIKLFVPSYGSDAIWSYWGAQYITLLADLSKITGKTEYAQTARNHVTQYEKAIVRDGGFAETFSSDGQFLQSGIYKSIRITGWVVQFEHARSRLEN